MRYRMILFDFFNTLVVSDSSRTPTLTVGEQTVISTAHSLRQCLARKYPQFDVMQVHHALRAAAKKARDKRGPELKEPPALERFRDLAAELGLAPEDENTPRELLACHMEAVTNSFALPEGHLRVLRKLRTAHRLGIFSNFDHAPSLLAILRHYDIESWFDPVVISETIGFRKPGEAAFRQALALTGEAKEHILFVGDSLEEDVRGALRAEVDVAWINPRGEAPPPGVRPTYMVAELAELEPLLERLLPADG